MRTSFVGCGGRIWTNDLRVMSTSKPVGQSYVREQKRQFAPIFRRRFADRISQSRPHKAYHFPSLTGKITKVSGKCPFKGKTLGKNKSDKRQDKRQQKSCKLTKFPDSPQIFRGRAKNKEYRKRFWKIGRFTDKKISDAYRDIWFRIADGIFVWVLADTKCNDILAINGDIFI